MDAAEVLKISISPQRGPQTAFLETAADIALYGGGAGGGKSFALLLDPLRHFKNPKFGGVVFRRNATQVRIEGGLWDESKSLYGPLGAYPREQQLDWRFPSGMRMKFAHLDQDDTVLDYQGAQIPYLGFDELTHFTERQFLYMMSRNRSTSGVPGYVRATCNPDADSWVRKLVDWWIDPQGFPIKERSGVLRWFIRREDSFIWDDTRQALIDRHGADELPKSFTFIPSSVFDNKVLMAKDPSYLANLRALSRVDRQRLLDQNWNVRAKAGDFFRREWFGPLVEAIPSGWVSAVRFWDRAATRPTGTNDPDWTRGVKLFRYPNDTYLVADVRSAQETPGQVEGLIKATASHDGYTVRIGAQQDPGSAGKGEAEHFVRMLTGFDVRTSPSTRDKQTRAKPVSAQCEAGNIRVMRAPWNEDFFKELEAFPTTGVHDDQVDALAGAFNELSGAFSLLNVL